MTDTNESLLELISESQLELHQVPAVMNNRKAALPTYKFRRPPSIEELKQLTGLFSIWQANKTLILTEIPTVHGSGVIVYHDSENSCIRCVSLADNRCFWFSSGFLRCTIIGKSDHAIAETAAFLWGLDSDSHFKDICCLNERFNFGVVSTEQLGLLFRNSPTMQVCLHVCDISPVQSKFLAQMPYPIFLSLEESLGSFSDGGHAFADSLLRLRRNSSFGSLKLWKIEEQQNDTFQRLLQAKAMDKLELSCARPQQIRQLLSASVKSIAFTIKVRDSLAMDWSTVEILPKELSLEFSCFETEAHIDFICSFLRRIAVLGDFVKLEFALCREWDTIMPNSIARELIHAVSANQSLVELHLRHDFTPYSAYLGDIFAMIERHGGLRRFKINEYPEEEVDSGYSMLKQLLRQNRHIDVIKYNEDRVTDGDEIDQLYAFNRFFRDSQGLAQEPLSLLPSLVREALTHGASGDFRRSALLMANHTDSLCELVQYSSLFSSETHVSNDQEGPVDTDNVSSPKRETGSLPAYACKRKRQRVSSDENIPADHERNVQ